ncbi:MAG: threonine/serine exporter family protein [Lachnospirales bacterium]
MELSEVLVKSLASFIATMAISITMYAPKNEIVYCGGVGALGYFTYSILLYNGLEPTVAVTVAAMVFSIFSRIFAYNRKRPVTVFLTPGFIPLSPGSLIYYTMSHLLNGENALAQEALLDAFFRAGCLSLGISFIFIIPHTFFKIKVPTFYK